MFSGIVEEVRNIVSIRRGLRSATLKIQGKKIFPNMKLGDSIAVNGKLKTISIVKLYVCT
ncbi:MAG: hypothetical protein IJE95_00515 [Methanocorpusculum sp.]|nr:hypothetical protein [Methanocorpusculum sp.]